MKKYYSKNKIKEFLVENNAIEGVFDDVSLEQAQSAWKFLMGIKKLTVNDILLLHRILMLHQNIAPHEKGFFRTVPVWVGWNEAMNWMLVQGQVDRWVIDANNLIRDHQKESDKWKEEMVKLHHIAYETIHPFVDGNGRTGRMLMNWERKLLGLPIMIIHADWPAEDGEQRNYYKWFKKG